MAAYLERTRPITNVLLTLISALQRHEHTLIYAYAIRYSVTAYVSSQVNSTLVL